MSAPSPLPAWWLAACRKRFGLSQTRPAGMPKPAPVWCILEWERFEIWNAWRYAGAGKPRPSEVWRRVPWWAWQIRRELLAKHREPAPPPPAPVPQPAQLSPPSWTLPGPLILSGVQGDTGHAIDPATGKPRGGVASVGQIEVGGVAPLWRCEPVNGQGTGWLAQIEGPEQVQTAYDLLKDKPTSDSRAIIGIGNVPANTRTQDGRSILDLGVNFYFIELNAQAGWEPYGNAGKILFQAKQDGWPHYRLSYGVYLPVSLGDYFDYVPDVTTDGGRTWRKASGPQGVERDCAIFSGQGMGDTGSWGTLARLAEGWA